MKKHIIIGAVIALTGLGCQNAKTHTAEGAVIGGVLGAAAGGIIGHQSRHGGEGAGIGVAAGALVGALVGSQMEKAPAATQGTPGSSPAASVAASANQMTLGQIVDLSKQGVHEAVIIDKIHLSNSRFRLTETDVAYLKEQGVSSKVIDAMQGK